MPSVSINAKEEIYKILKYQKKMKEQNEQSGGGSRSDDYREKIQEHRQNLMDAGYKKQEIERMIQKGGGVLDGLLHQVNEKIDAKCENVSRDVTLVTTSATAKINELSQQNEQLSAENVQLKKTQKTDQDEKTKAALVTENQKLGAEITVAEAALGKILERLSRPCPQNPPPVGTPK